MNALLLLYLGLSFVQALITYLQVCTAFVIIETR